MAVRFAAKEAVSKAFGTGIGSELGWQDIEVLRKPSGEPLVQLSAKGELYRQQRKVEFIHISLSHTEIYAVASAILEG